VLFAGDEVTGIIDFGAMRMDTPLADVARLLGSLVGDDRDNRQLAFDTYAELRPLSEADRQFVDLLDKTGLILSVFNWLRWLYVERRDMGEPAPIARRLEEILARLESRARPIV
jgi:Ser/Thr protein kinase RdoA (MazF antagonist)